MATAQSAKAVQDAQIRLSLNLKNLRRHDPAIVEIVGQSAYVGAYWNDGSGWVSITSQSEVLLVEWLTL